MNKFSIIAIVLVTFFSSCNEEAKEKVVTNNASFNVELLFEIDGCKVYRFMDVGRNRYFSTCQGSVSWNESIGKSAEAGVDVPTNIKK